MLVPLRASLVTQAFPALGRIACFGGDVPSRASDVDLVRQRRLLFASVRELFARVAERHTLVLFIDDLQWADADSLAMLDEVTRGPEPPPLFLLATERSDGVPNDALPKRLREATRVALGPLAPEDAAELARRLAASADATVAVDVQAIARDTEGHPLFIDELVRQAVAGGADPTAPRVDDALAARIAALDPSARELLECVSLAARPTSRAVLARATSLHRNDTYRFANILTSANLVRASGPRAERLEPYHDRVRHAALRAMDPTRAIKRHRRIAAALEADDDRDDEALAYHWRAAQKPDRAAPYAEAAAAEAERALAFEQAAHLYRMALELRPPNDARRSGLFAKLGDALANAGQSAEAAIAYRHAAAGVDAAEGATHLQKAADQLLRAGHIEEGFALANELLAQLGLPAPRARWLVLASFLFWRCVFAVRGLSFRERSVSEIPPRDLARIDVVWSLTSALSTIDPIRGAYFQMRHLRMALRAGEPYRVVRAAALQIGYGAGPGADRWLESERVAERCAALSERIGNPHGVALTQLAAGIASYLQGRFERALDLLDDAELRLRACPGSWGEIARARRFAVSALASLGRMRELRARVHAHLRDARAHGDLHATTSLRIGHPNLAWLMEDDVAAARRELDGAMAEWPLGGFQLEHHYALFASTNIDLYAGEPARARAAQLVAWPALERSFLLRIDAARVIALSSRARAAIALAERSPREAEALLREAERLAARVSRERLPFAAPTAALLRAGIASVRGRPDLAIAHASSASRAFVARGMHLMAAAAHRSGALVAGDAAAIAAVDDWMTSEEIASPPRMSAMLAPGFAHFARRITV